jgi:hypothetical protein
VRLAAGGLAGFVLAIILAPLLRSFFSVPDGGVGVLTVTGYPKGFDHVFPLVITLLTAIGAIAACARGKEHIEPVAEWQPSRWRPALAAALALAIFALYFIAHDHRYYEMDMFHEGEHLSPAAIMREGGRPFGDVFLLHGFAVDGGLDLLLLGDPPSPLRVRIAQTVLDAATVALLAPIAAELALTPAGILAASVAGFAALGAGQVQVFPYFRLAPLLIAIWLALRHSRTGSRSALIGAAVASGLGVCWSYEVGLYSCAALIAFLLVRRKWRDSALTTGIMLVSMVALLALVRADLTQFVVDSFLTIPRSIDAVWGVAAPALPEKLLDWVRSEGARYYLPPAWSGLLLALALIERRRGNRARSDAMLVVALFSMVAFRTASGRSGWSHTRFGTPLLGVSVIAFALEPLIQRARRKEWAAAVGALLLGAFLIPFFELPATVTALRKFFRERSGRIVRPAGSVPHPLPTGRGLYTNVENATDLLLLSDFTRRHASGKAPIFVYSGEKALYYLLSRPSSTRVHDVPMMSAPKLLHETLQLLDQRPPAFIIVSGPSRLDQFDGVTNDDRVPALKAWIDERYPVRVNVGRYVVALPRK